MKVFLYFSFSLLVLVITSGRIYCQRTELNADTLNIKNFKEEVYVQTDRDIYITGEQIWLKIYKLSRLNSSPVNESKVIYVELLDNSGNIIKQLKTYIDGISGGANIKLSDTLRTGNYLIRAYSNWMQNYPEDLFFYKYISIVDPFRNIDKLIKREELITPDSIKFFPEGGRMLAGITNKTGIRSQGFDGGPVKTEGVIVNSKNEVIASVKTDSLGYGVVELTPSKTENFFVQFKTPGGSVRRQPLPGISDKGITISVDPDNPSSSIKIKLLRRGNFTPEGKFCKLSVISTGLVTWMKEINTDRDSIIEVPRNGIPSGSSLVLLLDGNGNRLAGRWIFNRNNGTFNLTINVPNQDLSSRKLATVNVETSDKAGNPVAADLSMSIVKSSLFEKGRINILTRGEYAAFPGEWLSGLTDDDINNRLLSFRNDPDGSGGLLGQPDTVPGHLPELGGQLVNGVLRSKLTHDPLKDTDISLAFIGKTSRCQFLKTDEKGEFNFVVNKPGLSEIVIQPLKPVQSGYYVEFNQPFCTTFNDHIPPVFSLDSTRTDDINKAVISMQVNKIYEPFREQNKPVSRETKVNDFYGEPDKRINLADYIELTTVREVLKEIVPDIIVVKKNKEYQFKMVNLPFSTTENNPLVLVDGVPFYNLGKLLDVNSKELERIDILNSRYYYTDYVFDGIVSFITKRGNLSSMDYDNTVFRQAFEGCQLPQEFYSPDHSSKNDGTFRIPDFRNTLYWKPDLRSGKDGKASVSFFTSDEPGEYTIIVEGVTPDGKTGISRIPFIIK